MTDIVIDMEEVNEIEHGLGNNAKKPVDDSAPKRPKTAYFLWADTVRMKLIKDNPDSSAAQLGKIMGAQWNKLAEKAKDGFKKKFTKNREKFAKAWDKYTKTKSYAKHQTEFLAWKIHQTKKPYRKDTHAPKRYQSAYQLFTASVRQQIVADNPDLEASDIMKKQGEMWQELASDAKKPWEDKSGKLKAKFQKDLGRYLGSDEYQEYITEKKEYKHRMQHKRNRLMGVRPERKAKKQKRARSARRSVSRKRRARSRSKTMRSRTPKRSRKRKRSRTPKRRRASRTPKANKRASSSSKPRRKSRSRSRKAKRARKGKATKKRKRSVSSRAGSRGTGGFDDLLRLHLQSKTKSRSASRKSPSSTRSRGRSKSSKG